METAKGLQTSERFRIGALLAVAGGLLDAYTYLMRDGVFANAQTGNIVLLGVRAVEGDWSGVLHYLLPILAFAAGVIAAECIKERLKEARVVHWRQVTVCLEIILLALVAFLPQQLNALANIMVSFVCAIQVESFRKVRGNALSVCISLSVLGRRINFCGPHSTVESFCFSLVVRRWVHGAAAF